MSNPTESERLGRRGAAAILAAFEDYWSQFQEITHRAQETFERCDWHGAQHDAGLRLGLYDRVVTRIVAEIRDLLGTAVQDRRLWTAMKDAIAEQVPSCAAIELAETFFNSVTRRLLATVGVDPAIEFLSADFDVQPPAGPPVFTPFSAEESLPGVIREVLAGCAFSVRFEDLKRDACLVARAIQRQWRRTGMIRSIDTIDMINRVFYRNKGAYLVGRLHGGGETMPLALALQNGESGLYVDAVLLTANEVSVLFSYTRSYFHVEVDRPHDLTAFLQSLMPHKPVSELYTALGFHKHGKTELYRNLFRHLEQSSDRFEIARGDRGMVMIVFTLPSVDVVFKVIRDTFAYPKTSTRSEVIDRYRLVFQHDRAGRLADAQVFEHLTFPRDRFSEELLAELADAAAESVTIDETTVDIKHLYTERRMIPLNLFLRETSYSAALNAVVDYGQAVKDLAAANIFPGDMLLKNFGVTRYRRVIFYDYDELCLLTDCQFRELPPPSDFDEEFSAEPWYSVGPYDVFPEEFRTFLGLRGEQREAFLQAHGDLLTVEYWRTMQAQHRAGELIDIPPYHPSQRLRRR